MKYKFVNVLQINHQFLVCYIEKNLNKCMLKLGTTEILKFKWLDGWWVGTFYHRF
jgi:hypothetical protein